MNKFIFFSLILFLSCSDNESQNNPQNNPQNPNTEWLIPVSQVFDGGPGKDGIPAIDSPNFDNVGEVDFLNNNDLVIGMVHNGVAKAYPHAILDWHEIVNDEISDIHFGLTYCPLTGTAIAWDRNVNGNITTFGVSGKLYNTNLMPYDRASDSYWSQMRMDCVNGSLIGSKISTYNVIETKWATWKKAYPHTKVLNTNTGYSRNYGDYPYGDYRTNDANIIFPLTTLDNRLPAKERVLGLISENANKIYSLGFFEEDKIIIDNYNGKDIIVIGSKKDNFIVAFENKNLTNLTFSTDQLPVIAEDENGNKITLSGKIVNGPMAGTQLEPQNSFIGYFFAFGAFYADLEIYE